MKNIDYKKWIENQFYYISDKLYEEARQFLEIEANTKINYLLLDNRWHYIGKNQKQGYKGHIYQDNEGKPRLDLVFHPFKGSKETVLFKDLTVIASLWTEELTGKASKPQYKTDNKARKEAEEKEAANTKYKQELFEKLKEYYPKAPIVTKSTYCDRKKIPIVQGMKTSKGAYRYTNRYDCINLPITTMDKGTIGFQQIFDENVVGSGKDKTNKSFVGKLSNGFVLIESILTEGLKIEPCVSLSAPFKLDELIICEGFATGMSLHLASGLPVFCCLSIINLKKVLPILRKTYGTKSKCKIYLAPDNDKAKEFELDDKGKPKINIGLVTVHKLAIRYGCYVLPIESEHKSIDFNDLHVRDGIGAVIKAVNSAQKPNPIVAFTETLRGLVKGDRYLKPIEDLIDGVTFIKSPQGTGKTQALSKIVKDYRTNGISVLVITHRESLAYSLGKRFGLEIYNDLPQHYLRIQSGLVICVNSLYKLDEAAYFDAVIIEEAEQFIRNIKERHIQHKHENMTMFESILTKARKVTLLDADLGMLSYTLKEAYRPNDKVQKIENYYPVGENKKVVVVDKKGLALKAFYDALAKGEKTAFFCNSLDLSRAVHEEVSTRFTDLNVMVANSETSNTEAVREANTSPELFNQYDALIASPTIQTGISIEGNHFTKVVGCFQTGVGISDDFLQQLWRIREAKDYIVWFDSRNIHNPYSEKQLEEGFNAANQKEVEDLGNLETVDNEKYRRLKNAAIVLEARDKSSLRFNSIKKTTKQGFDISIANDKEEDDINASSATRVTKEAGNRVYVRERLNAKDISSEKASQIQKKQSPSKEEILELSRFQTKQIFKWENQLGRELARSILIAKATTKSEAERFSLITDDIELFAEALLLNKDGKFAKQLKYFRVTSGGKENAETELKHERGLYPYDSIRWNLVWEFYQKLYEAVDFKNALEGAPVYYSSESTSIQNFVEWVVSEHRKSSSWLPELPFIVPVEKAIRKSPIQCIRMCLNRVGLKQKRVGDFHNGEYTLDNILVRFMDTLTNFDKRSK